MRLVARIGASRRAFDDALDAYGHACRERDAEAAAAAHRRAFDALAVLLKTIDEAHGFGNSEVK